MVDEIEVRITDKVDVASKNDPNATRNRARWLQGLHRNIRARDFHHLFSLFHGTVAERDQHKVSSKTHGGLPLAIRKLKKQK